MKNKLKVLGLLMGIIFLVGCGNSTTTKAIEDGKIAIASQEYEKAERLFKLACDEDNKNNEAKMLYELVENYLLLTLEIDNGNYIKSKEYLDIIEKNEKKDILEKELNLINERIVNGQKYDSRIKEIRGKLSSNLYEEAKELSEEVMEEVRGIIGIENIVYELLRESNEAIEKEEIDNTAKIDGFKSKIKEIANLDNDIAYVGIKVFEEEEDMPKDLINRTTYIFKDTREMFHGVYFYDELTNDVFCANQGQVFWVNNGNRNLVAEVEEQKGDIIIGLEEAQELVNKYVIPLLNEYENKEPRVIEGNFIKGSDLYNNLLPINEMNNNFYSVLVQDNRQAHSKYVVNAFNGNIYMTGTGEKIN